MYVSDHIPKSVPLYGQIRGGGCEWCRERDGSSPSQRRKWPGSGLGTRLAEMARRCAPPLPAQTRRKGEGVHPPSSCSGRRGGRGPARGRWPRPCELCASVRRPELLPPPPHLARRLLAPHPVLPTSRSSRPGWSRLGPRMLSQDKT